MLIFEIVVFVVNLLFMKDQLKKAMHTDDKFCYFSHKINHQICLGNLSLCFMVAVGDIAQFFDKLPPMLLVGTIIFQIIITISIIGIDIYWEKKKNL